MATQQIKWRTNAISGYVEGESLIYVHSRFGSDKDGNGTRQKPYRTIAKANSKITKASWIVLCGVFKGNVVGKISSSTYWANLRGDYYGAAIYDGEGVNFLSWFGSYTNMILINCLSDIEATTQGYDYNNKYAYLVGVGRAAGASYATHAVSVSGFASSPVLCHNSKLWRGCAGFSYTSGGRIVYASPVRNAPTCGVVLSGSMLSTTYYNAKRFMPDMTMGTRERRNKNNNVTQYAATNQFGLFVNWDIFVDEGMKDTYTQCCFGNDCEFIYSDKTLEGAPDMRIRLTNPDAQEIAITLDADNHITAIEGVKTIPAAISALRTNGNITQTASLDPTFTNCKFLQNEGKNEIFQNADALDFTLKYGCGAMEGQFVYYGALPPTRSIGVVYDPNNQYASDGHTDCFDNRTKNGCISIVDDAVCVEESSPVNTGSIYSKIVRNNPLEIQYSGVYSLFADQYAKSGILLNKDRLYDDIYYDGDSMDQVGIYLVRGGDVTYRDVVYSDGDVIYVDDLDVVYAITCDENVRVYHIETPSAMNVMYCRCRSHIYATITRKQIADGDIRWATGIFYMNTGSSPIQYNGRTIVSGESFIIDDPNVGITGVPEDYEIAIMFDDRDVYSINGGESGRIVPTTEWIPAQLWGEYFVGKKYGAILHDDSGVPLSSGNPNAYNESGIKSVDGYYSIMNQPYTQFAIFVNKE